MTKIKAAVFASGTGSNFQAIIEANQDKELGCEIVLLVCDKPGAKVVDKATDFGVPTCAVDPKSFSSKEAYEKEVVAKLHEADVTYIFLAGYMRIVGPTLLRAYDGAIINIHPSLLPAFPGLDAIGQAFRAHVHTTGVTIHYIDEGVDTGPIIDQEALEILPSDTEETLKQRIQEIEHRLYPKVIKHVLNR
ncbi:phosphoribosylglycinamide formyltransferase [Virgibacillus phasianinus]|uniref:Phosphoribosylglycinamide formyltransferase n=1 Tax=Virgibacillus phasianinus TaxID=2017483 RepID=A0A220TZR8_9BACI|nr:phosphoribosylglycinamide formyltransferase [Virgibacillus phasianinus]ASK61176.1 phosphoribosylglycinamide formyltransferase [Virgibacillus phasianinus]